MSSSTLSTLPRFVANGLFATAVHYLALRSLVEFGGVASIGLANGLAAVVGISVSYLGNKMFVFRSADTVSGTLPKFLVIYAAVALLHFGFLTLWSDIWHLDYTLGFLLATAASTVLSFLANRYFVFR
ncbi:GtrA family protein [Bosea sp. NBC_00550]|uniref:GtrA family protein n=1 Tax=Bosea sp. NBC_00550 TaxID=2969621 RepID=UPI00222F9E6B|nr:GtrA family protein [Bosea sp. NBC_00550]UZF91304.1 GtrA family protein [Bosea sp. NBC_00550]